jgi:5-methylcytosine-specific restriction protein A
MIFLFTGKPGEPFGYRDWWEGDQLFHYYGEGQRGDMEFRAGNKAIRDHAANGKELHVFFMERHNPDVRYLGQMRYTGHDLTEAPDFDHQMRQAIVFRLQPVS